jgi:hypothetical protein
MAQVLNDVNGIIIPIGEDFKKTFKSNIDSMFENLIIYDNQIFNTYIFNHCIYTENDNNFQQNCINIILRHFLTYFRKQQLFFRENMKKNKFTLASFNLFIDNFYKLLIYIDKILVHFTLNKNDSVNFPPEQYKWGSSNIVINAIKNLSIILTDIIIIFAVQKSINTHLDIERNDEMYRFIRYIKIFITYDESNNKLLNNIINCIDETLLKYIDISIPIECGSMQQVYQFKLIYQQYFENENKYYYIKNDNKIVKFQKVLEYMNHILIEIIQKSSIEFIQSFMREYKHELVKLEPYINTENNFITMLTSKNIDSFENMINYYGTLYDIYKNNSLTEMMIMICITNKLHYINTENMIELTEMINTDIILKNTPNYFLYMIGANNKNIDEFIKLLSLKLKLRIIYTDINYDNEMKHCEILEKYFTARDLYQYNVIKHDYLNSIQFMNLDKMNNVKVIITSLDSWHINHRVGHVNTISGNGSFSLYLDSIINNYNITSQDQKILILYPHLGILDITINTVNQSHIILTPAQMLCLELFEDNSIMYNYEQLFEKTKIQLEQYNDEFIHLTIKSLIQGGVIISIDMTKEVVQNKDIDTSYLLINNDMPLDIDLIKIFNSMSTNNYKEELVELAHERNDIIMANINSKIKHGPLENNELYKYCQDTIKQFNVTEDLFNIAIKIMKDKKYIVDDPLIQKICYV